MRRLATRLHSEGGTTRVCRREQVPAAGPTADDVLVTDSSDGRAGIYVRVGKNLLADHDDHWYLPEAVQENEEVVPVNAVSTWVLPSGVTVGR